MAGANQISQKDYRKSIASKRGYDRVGVSAHMAWHLNHKPYGLGGGAGSGGNEYDGAGNETDEVGSELGTDDITTEELDGYGNEWAAGEE